MAAPRALGQGSAVDDEYLARHKRGFVGGKVESSMANLVWLADSADRLGLFEMAAVLLVLPEILAEIGLDQARRDGVDAHAVRAKFACPASRHHNQPGLGKAVEQAASLRLQPGNGGDIDDRTAAFPL